MAEDPKIIVSPPPAEPKAVSIIPSPPPAEPFDVDVLLSPPPAEPFDVEVFPDPPPAGTKDVPTTPVGPPLETFDVETIPVGPPKDPFDVSTLPDAPPADPFDVSTLPDGPPADPFDVSILPDGPPIEPFDVVTNADDPPVDPFDVIITLDPPPAGTVDPALVDSNQNPGVQPLPDPEVLDPAFVNINQDPGKEPLPDPVIFDPGINVIRDHREPVMPVINLSPEARNMTTTEIIAAVRDYDYQLAVFIDGIDKIDKPIIGGTGGGALDPRILAKWFKDYVSSVGNHGFAKFIAEQFALYAMNPVVAKVFNPGHFIEMMVPGSMGNIHTTLDTQAGVNTTFVARAEDEKLKAAIGLKPSPGAESNVFSSERKFTDGNDFSIEEMVESAIDGSEHQFLSKQKNDSTGLKPLKVFDSLKYFEDRDSNGTMNVKAAVRLRTEFGSSVSTTKLAKSAFTNGIIRVPIGPAEEADGAVYSDTQDPSNIVDDDDARIPLCFTDLRKDTRRGKFRSIYFRPLDLNISNAVSPEWTDGSAFGRVDPILTYSRTTRNFSVSFAVHAFAPEDLRVMYNKMVLLTSMCYPSFSNDALLKSGPVIRLRVGDIMSTNSGGLTGVIKNLNFDFAEALWELKKGLKVPRSFSATLEFTALHEGPVGIVDGTFGTFKLPSGGNPATSTGNGADAKTAVQEPSRTVTATPGFFSKFGEPK